MKKTILTLLAALSISAALPTYASVCDVGTLGYDAIDCAALGNANGNPGQGGAAATVPIDGGASLLIAGGFALGARKAKCLFNAR